MSWNRLFKRFPAAATLAAAAAASLLTACAASPIQGARKPPDAWVPGSNACPDIAGTYSAVGAPAPQNSDAWLYTVVWPNVGSLASFAERGTNGIRYFPPLAQVRIDVDASGRPSFKAFDTAGDEEPLKVREWWCENGTLVTRGPLNLSQYAQEHHQESLVRVWKARDGALIVEDTFREVRHHFHDSKASHEPFARFYFRFPEQTARVAARLHNFTSR
jgi:hypothetical protein